MTASATKPKRDPGHCSPIDRPNRASRHRRMPPAKRNSDESLSPLSTNDGLARPSIKTSASACNPQVSAVASALTLCGDARPKTAAIDGSETLEQHESQQRSQAHRGPARPQKRPSASRSDPLTVAPGAEKQRPISKRTPQRDTDPGALAITCRPSRSEGRRPRGPGTSRASG